MSCDTTLNSEKRIGMVEEIFYVTGRGGSIHEGLGVFLKERAKEVSGVGLSDEFLSAVFDEQIAAIRKHFKRIENERIPVIANSYGAYLLLNSLIGFAQLRTKVLLLSPVVGALVSKIGYFRPPHKQRIPIALRSNDLKKPEHLVICVGRLDYQCDLSALEEIAKALQADRFSIFDGQGHMIDKNIVQAVVDEFLQAQFD